MSEQNDKSELDMFFTEDQEASFSKVPYDEEPISRGGYRYRSNGGARRYEERRKPISIRQFPMIVYILLALLIVFNSAIGVLFIKSYREQEPKQSIVNISYPSNYNSISGSMQSAAAKALLSSCAVGATMSSMPITTEDHFYNNNNSFGSGVVFSVDKSSGEIIIVTNYHVIYQVTEEGIGDGYFNNIYILLSDSLVPIRVEFVGGSANYDIAVLRATNNNEVKKSKVIAATFGDSTDIRIGQAVVAIGNSRALGLQATTGSISVEEEVLGGKNAGKPVNFMLMRHSAEINGGNSGGGLFDSNGNIVGLVNGRYTASDGNYIKSDQVIQGMNFAIPGLIVQSVANNILYYSIANPANEVVNLMRPKIGIYTENIIDSGRNTKSSNCYISEKSFDISDEYGIKTTYKTTVNANVSGFMVGDVIQSFSYRSTVVNCNKRFSLDSHIYNLREGDVIDFYVKRGEQTELVKVSITVSGFEAIF